MAVRRCECPGRLYSRLGLALATRHQLVRLLDVLAQLVQRRPLAEHAGDFQQAADEPVAVLPVFEGELASHGPGSCLASAILLILSVLSNSLPFYFTGSIAKVNGSAITVPARGSGA